MINKVILIGNLGKEPEIRFTKTGKIIANLTVATNERWTNKETGEPVEKTEWHRVVIFNEGTATYVEKYLHKGSKVYIEGKLQTRKWTDNQGVDHYTTEIVLDGFNFALKGLDPKENRQSQENNRNYDQNNQNDDLDDEIPF